LNEGHRYLGGLSQDTTNLAIVLTNFVCRWPRSTTPFYVKTRGFVRRNEKKWNVRLVSFTILGLEERFWLRLDRLIWFTSGLHTQAVQSQACCTWIQQDLDFIWGVGAFTHPFVIPRQAWVIRYALRRVSASLTRGHTSYCGIISWAICRIVVSSHGPYVVYCCIISWAVCRIVVLWYHLMGRRSYCGSILPYTIDNALFQSFFLLHRYHCYVQSSTCHPICLTPRNPLSAIRLTHYHCYTDWTVGV